LSQQWREHSQQPGTSVKPGGEQQAAPSIDQGLACAKGVFPLHWAQPNCWPLAEPTKPATIAAAAIVSIHRMADIPFFF